MKILEAADVLTYKRHLESTDYKEKSFVFAAVLYHFGVRNMRPTYHFRAGHERVDQILAWPGSLLMTPRIDVRKPRGFSYVDVNTLPIFLMREDDKMTGGGGANDDWMQIYFGDMRNITDEIQRGSGGHFADSVLRNFLAIKHFVNSRKRNKSARKSNHF